MLVYDNLFELSKSLELLHVFIFDKKLFHLDKSLLFLQPFKHYNGVIIIHKENIMSVNIHSKTFFWLYLVNTNRIIIVPRINFLDLTLSIMTRHIKDMAILVHLQRYRLHLELLSFSFMLINFFTLWRIWKSLAWWVFRFFFFIIFFSFFIFFYLSNLKVIYW